MPLLILREELIELKFSGHCPAENYKISLATLGPVQTSNFTCAESNANDKNNSRILLISIRFGTCEVRRLNRALYPLILLNATNNTTDQAVAIVWR